MTLLPITVLPSFLVTIGNLKSDKSQKISEFPNLDWKPFYKGVAVIIKLSPIGILDLSLKDVATTGVDIGLIGLGQFVLSGLCHFGSPYFPLIAVFFKSSVFISLSSGLLTLACTGSSSVVLPLSCKDLKNRGMTSMIDLVVPFRIYFF